MARLIHCVETPSGPLFREWSTVVDCYVTEPMTWDEAIDYLTSDAVHRARSEATTRLARAEQRGTSEIDGRRDRQAWDTERCDGCGGFHHEWDPGEFSADFDTRGRPTDEQGCKQCGLTIDEPSHGPPCVAGLPDDEAEGA